MRLKGDFSYHFTEIKTAFIYFYVQILFQLYFLQKTISNYFFTCK